MFPEMGKCLHLMRERKRREERNCFLREEPVVVGGGYYSSKKGAARVVWSFRAFSLSAVACSCLPAQPPNALSALVVELLHGVLLPGSWRRDRCPLSVPLSTGRRPANARKGGLFLVAAWLQEPRQ